MAIQHLLFQTIPNRIDVRQMLAYPDSAVRFIQTHCYGKFHGDTKINENIVYLPTE